MNCVSIALEYTSNLTKKSADNLLNIMNNSRLSDDGLINELHLGFQFALVMYGLLQCDKNQKCTLLNNTNVKKVIENLNVKLPSLLLTKNYSRSLKILSNLEDSICHKCRKYNSSNVSTGLKKAINSVSSIYSIPYFMLKSKTPMMRLLFLNFKDDVILDSSSEARDWMAICSSILKGINNICVEIQTGDPEFIKSITKSSEEISEQINEIKDLIEKDSIK